MSTWQFHLVNLQGLCPVWTISISFVYKVLLVWVFLQLHKLNLTYCLKSSLLLPFCFLFISTVDQNQIYPSSLIHLTIIGLFQEIICNIHSVVPNPPSLLIGRFGFLKNHRKGDQDFLVKIGGSPYSHIRVGMRCCL